VKACTKCGTEKPLEDFAADRTKRDGRKGQCKECVAAKARTGYSSTERAKKHLEASPRARSLQTIRNRNSRWNSLAAEHGESWLIEQVQSLKAGGHLSWEAIQRAEKDKRLGTFFRRASVLSPEALRSAFSLGSWDKVRGMTLTRADWVARAMRFHRAAGAGADKLRSMYEKRWPGQGLKRIREEADDAPAICDNHPNNRQQRVQASDRILGKK
jgi:hypothetical protein